MTMAFLPCPTSIYKNPGVSENAAQCPPPLRYNRGHAYEYRSSSLSEVPLKAPTPFSNFVSLCWCIFSSYLASRHELQRTQSALHVRDVGLELIQGGSDVGLDLGRFLPRRAVGSDLVERLLRHRGGDVLVVESERRRWWYCLQKFTARQLPKASVRCAKTGANTLSRSWH